MRFDIIPQNLSGKRFPQGHMIKGKSYWLETEVLDDCFLRHCEDLFKDPVDEFWLYKDISMQWDYIVQVSFRPGVTDNSARSIQNSLRDSFPHKSVDVATGELYLIQSEYPLAEIEAFATALYNPLIQRIDIFSSHQAQDYIPSPDFPKVQLTSKEIQWYDFESLDEEELIKLSEQNLWALNHLELREIKKYFTNPSTKAQRVKQGLSTSLTDIEIEIIAQTWSEHCKHKIFNAEIDYSEADHTGVKVSSKKIKSIFKSHIVKSTQKINKEWLVSVFSDNAGIVRFGDKNDYCFKVETHNSPSALDPYGGALTGILGVNRDILGCGIGAEPIANTNILCFASQRYSTEILNQLPAKLLRPQKVLQGVHRGIEDGGNKSGVPTINGAFHFHDNYAGKPLVYCGTVGVLPQQINGKPTHLKNQQPGDYIVVCGGAVGADGIHGATFSSLELDANSPSTAVQIGDPFTQKKVTDFLLKARDLELYTSLTDNGAGGLSSSVGEMAEATNGAQIELNHIPTKYPGLSPFELIISESQERMTFAVNANQLEEFLALATEFEVNPAVIGQFHDRGSFDIYLKDQLVASLDLNFLHNGLPAMQLKAHFLGSTHETSWYQSNRTQKEKTLPDKIFQLMSHENIASKEHLVRQYDHEVKGATIGKPYLSQQLSGPADAGVIWLGAFGDNEQTALAVSNGICPEFSHLDTYFMTQMAIDEALRNAICVGANPDFIALCDNYCWPDPIGNDPARQHKLAQLVRSTTALYETALLYQTPFISGKDSMKNDFVGVDKHGLPLKISVPPTLLISALGKIDNIEHFTTSDFKTAGDFVLYIGPDDFKELTLSTMNPQIKNLPKFNAQENMTCHRQVHQLIKSGLIKSCHDVSQGGIVTSIIESCFPQQLGFKFAQNFLQQSESFEAFLFNELPAGYIISIDQKNLEHVTKYRLLGQTMAEKNFILPDQTKLSITKLYSQWSQSCP